MWTSLILAAVNELPAIGQLITKYQASGVNPTADQVNADLAALGISDDDLKAAYERAYPGQPYPG